MKPIITHKTLIAICMVILITVSLAACLGGNEDDTEGVESTTTPGTTTPGTTTTPPPSRNLSAAELALVGTWVGERSYDLGSGETLETRLRSCTFYADGTFLELNSVRFLLTPPDIYNNKYTGTWSATEGTIVLVYNEALQGSDPEMEIWNEMARNYFDGRGNVITTPWRESENFNYVLSSDGQTLSLEKRLSGGAEITDLIKQ